jgi:glycyl-tRNA synthetase
MEMEFFCTEEESMEWFNYWKQQRKDYYLKKLGFREDELQFHDHDQLAHYAKAAVDIEFKFPFGFGELEGIHHRGTWDLSRHQEFSGENMEYLDMQTGKKFLPTCVETSVGLDRTILAVLTHAYDEDKAPTKKEGMEDDVRIVLHFTPMIAPVQVAVMPLSKKLNENAEALQKDICRFYRSELDVTGNIGKRYRRQDEIGTPFCLTYDFESSTDNAVTVRNRDTMEQERVSISNLKQYLDNKIYGW